MENTATQFSVKASVFYYILIALMVQTPSYFCTQRNDELTIYAVWLIKGIAKLSWSQVITSGLNSTYQFPLV